MQYVVFAIYLVLSIGGMILVKLGVTHPLSFVLKGGSLSVSAGWITILGLCCYIGSFLLWTKLVSMFELSRFVPVATGITQVVVFLVAIIFFKESFTTVKLIGMMLTVLGIVLLNIK